ncbi:MAG TPA: hypothetical protein VF753_00150 [Terriglobales bacterium]
MKLVATLTLLAIFLAAAVALSPAQSSTGSQSTTVVQNSPSSADQPLGDWARAQKKDKAKPAKVFDNDNMPTEDRLNIVGSRETEQTVQSADASSGDPSKPVSLGPDGKPSPTAKPLNNDKPLAVTPGESQEDRQKVYDEWSGKITDQQQKIDLATRELDVLQREYKLRAADFYADAGNRLRNSTDWDKQDADYKKQLADKQQALDNAKSNMDSMQEDARKSGVPNSVVEKAVGSDSSQPSQQ